MDWELTAAERRAYEAQYSRASGEARGEVMADGTVVAGGGNGRLGMPSWTMRWRAPGKGGSRSEMARSMMSTCMLTIRSWWGRRVIRMGPKRRL
eukprot:5310700-Prymnesium_polylepis.2